MARTKHNRSNEDLTIALTDTNPKLEKRLAELNGENRYDTNDGHINGTSMTITRSDIMRLPNMSPQDQLQGKDSTKIDISSTLGGISDTLAQGSAFGKAVRALSPEVDRAAKIVVGSILSPTDMQTDAVNITSKNIPSDEIEFYNDMSEDITSFFNREFRLGDRLAEWIRNGMFFNGSNPVMVTPSSDLAIAESPDVMESLEMLADNRGSFALESYASELNLDTMFDADHDCEILAAMESVLPVESIEKALAEDSKGKTGKKTSKEDIRKAALDGQNKLITEAKELVSKLVANKAEGEVGKIRISSDINKIIANRKSMEDYQNKMKKSFNEQFINKGNVNDNDIFVVGEATIDSGYPIVTELPHHAVIPVVVPGTKEKVGYFVLTDKMNRAIDPSDVSSGSGFSNQRLTSNAYAAYSSSNALSVSPTFKNSNTGFAGKEQQAKWEVLTKAFDITLRKFMSDSVGAISRSKGMELGIGQHHAVSSCMLFNLLNRRNVSLIFVPEPMMIYFDYTTDDNGIGESRVARIADILALKTILSVSQVMGAIHNSTDRNEITVDFGGEDVPNVEGILHMVREMYTAKYALPSIGASVHSLATDMARRKTTVKPLNLPGLETGTLSIENQERNVSAVQVDSELNDLLKDQLIQGLGVPPSALNEEEEYARAITSNNLLFANDVKRDQYITIQHTDKFIHLYTKMHPELQRRIIAHAIRHQVTGFDAGDDKVQATDNLKDDNNTPSISELSTAARRKYVEIVENLTLDLPTPNVSVGKAQFEEISTFISTLDAVVDGVIPQSMYDNTTDDSVKEIYDMIRHNVRIGKMRSYIRDIGVDVFNLESMEDLVKDASDNVYAGYHLLKNVAAGYTEYKESLEQESTDGDDDDDSGSSSNNSW